MVKPRVVETDEGIQDELEVSVYDRMARRFRDKGWMETGAIIKSGITSGVALEVGPGPGYLGLEWLKKTDGTSLRGLDISRNMIGVAERNAREYALTDRVQYLQGDARNMPFEDGSFDAAFTNGSMHEWAEPVRVLDEIHRVLKVGGRYFISDLRRDIFPPLKFLMWLLTKPKEIRPGLLSSLKAAYTRQELEMLLKDTALKEGVVKKNPIGLTATGMKTG